MARSRTRRRTLAVAVTNERGDRTVATNVSIELHVALAALCLERNVSKSEMLRRLIEYEVGEHSRCTRCGFVLDSRFALFPEKHMEKK